MILDSTGTQLAPGGRDIVASGFVHHDSAQRDASLQGGQFRPKKVCTYHIFAQFLVGEECAQQLCDHGLPLRMFFGIYQ